MGEGGLKNSRKSGDIIYGGGTTKHSSVSLFNFHLLIVFCIAYYFLVFYCFDKKPINVFDMLSLKSSKIAWRKKSHSNVVFVNIAAERNT